VTQNENGDTKSPQSNMHTKINTSAINQN